LAKQDGSMKTLRMTVLGSGTVVMVGIERRAPTHVNVNVHASLGRVSALFGSASTDTFFCRRRQRIALQCFKMSKPGAVEKPVSP
jgi:hypothetical protein